MIVDVRTYNIVPRKMKTYLALFEEHALPIQRRHIGDPLGYFVVELTQENSCLLILDPHFIFLSVSSFFSPFFSSQCLKTRPSRPTMRPL